MLDQLGQLLRAAIGCAGCSLPFYTAPSGRCAPGSTPGLASAMSSPACAAGLRSPTHALRREGMARDLLHDRDGTFADSRDGDRVGEHAVARDAAGGAAGEGGEVLTRSPGRWRDTWQAHGERAALSRSLTR